MLGNMRVNPQRRSNVSGIRPRLKLFRTKPEVTVYQNPNLGTAPNTVTVYNRATIKGLIYPYYKDNSTVTEWGQYPNPSPQPAAALSSSEGFLKQFQQGFFMFWGSAPEASLVVFPPLP